MLSIILPGIRTQNWVSLYNSIEPSLESKDFEVVFVGPYALPRELEEYDNVKFIRSFRHPTACSQLALLYSEGKYVSQIADDCLFVPGELKNIINNLNTHNYDAVITKYGEGNDVLDDWRYTYGAGYPRSPHINPNWIIFNSTVFNTDFLKKLGGWDCSFAVTCISMADLGARIHLMGDARIGFVKSALCHCSHEPNREGSHFAVHDSQILDDEPNFLKKWNKQLPPLIQIDINNWRQSQKIWERRFK